jgi:sterol 3beta-glucosyltransferase
MRITLMTIGTRGDTEPFVALAVRLIHEGHVVTLAARPDFAGLAAEYGVDFAPLGNPYEPFITGAASASAIGSGSHLLTQFRYGLKQRDYVLDHLHDDARRAAQGSDAIIHKYPWTVGRTIAEKLGIPSAAVMLFPLAPTRAFPSFLVGRGVNRGRVINRLVWEGADALTWQGLRWDDNKLRRQLGMRPLPMRGPHDHTPVLCAFSPAVVPRPADWPARMQLTGYWFLDPPPGWQPPADLLQFLNDGPPPVSIGFGSMPSADRDATLAVVLQALESSRQRAVLLSGWARIGASAELPPHVFVADNLPHSWLFPRVAAVVHHGGVGTTAAGLRSGVPSVLVPLGIDQPSWARVVHKLGAGPPAIPLQGLTAERLASAINEAVTNRLMRQRACEIGAQIRAEDGVGRAVELFTRYVSSRA